jgi:cytochrome b6-f complex iron-sulfur subunit
MKSKKSIKKVKPEELKAVKPTSPKDDVESRRLFLKKLWKGLGIIASVEFAVVFFGYLLSGKNDAETLKPKQLIEAGDINSFQPNTVSFFRGGRFYLVRLMDGGFLALSLRCTHLGCSINWEDDKNRFICPCHSSSFHINGEVQNPPAPSALDYFHVIIENGKVKVDIGTKLKRTRFSKDQAAYS